MRQQLQEEMELHTILENAIEKNALKISPSTRLPHYVCCYLFCLLIVEYFMYGINWLKVPVKVLFDEQESACTAFWFKLV